MVDDLVHHINVKAQSPFLEAVLYLISVFDNVTMSSVTTNYAIRALFSLDFEEYGWPDLKKLLNSGSDH